MASRVNGKPVKAGLPARIRLTDYESNQIRKIAVWKSKPPNPFAEIFHRVTAPGVKLVEKVIPDRLVHAAINGSFDLAKSLQVKAMSNAKRACEPCMTCERSRLKNAIIWLFRQRGSLRFMR